MRRAVAFLFVSHVSSCFAAFTDFSDYTESTTFSIGQSFDSRGVPFRVVELRANPNPVLIHGTALHPGPGVEFVLPPGIQEISFSYHDGAATAFAINGVEPQYVANRAGFSHFDGATLDGVSIDATVLSQITRIRDGQLIVGSETGFLTLRGPINSFTIAGLELSIDNVLIQVPEPSSCALLAVAAVGIIRRRARCRLRLRDVKHHLA